MQSREIITSINKIYQQFKIPTNLQKHMLRAAGIAEMICAYWQGPSINKDDIVVVNLIHDLGNIVKMDFKTKRGLKLIDKKDLEKISYWRKVQQEVITKYGLDDHLVTKKMLEKIKLSDRQKFLLDNKEFKRNKFIYESNDFDLKICAYGDQRSGPFSVLTIQERKTEWERRYKGRKRFKKITRKADLLFKYSKKIEKQIFEKTSLKPDDINSKSIGKYVKKYKNY